MSDSCDYTNLNNYTQRDGLYIENWNFLQLRQRESMRCILGPVFTATAFEEY